jgi:SAM-dependent methyltransferase
MEFRPHPVAWTDERVSRFWDYLASHNAGEFFSEKHAQDLARRFRGFRTVVDIGCGTGPLVDELARNGATAIGVDSSPGVLEAARKRVPHATFHLGSVTQIPLPDGSVDAAALVEVVEHLDDAILDAAITEARRVLRTHGLLLITTPNAEDLALSMRQCPECGTEFHIYQHLRRWTRAALRSYLEARGFTADVRGTRLVESGPVLERLARRLIYRLRREQPRLVALARRRPE